MKYLGKEDHFPFHSLDTSQWPGREILWAWCHPITATCAILGLIDLILWAALST